MEETEAGSVPTAFLPGDVVRSRDGRLIGVVLTVQDSSSDDTPEWELHVDAAEDGERQGVGIWSPQDTVTSNDPESIAEARRLGLRGIT